MTVSKKLAITQVILYSALTIVGIVVFVIAASMPVSTTGKSYIGNLMTAGIAVVFWWLISAAGFVIGIIQIVYKAKEQTSGVYLAAGICAILSLIPLVGFAALILNIIGWAIRN